MHIAGGNFWEILTAAEDGDMFNNNGSWNIWMYEGPEDGVGSWRTLDLAKGIIQNVDGVLYYWTAATSTWSEYENPTFKWKSEYSAFNGIWWSNKAEDIDFYRHFKLGNIPAAQGFELVEPCASPEYDATARTEVAKLGFRCVCVCV